MAAADLAGPAGTSREREPGHLDRAHAVPAGDEWAINSLALGPGRMLMADGYPRSRELLERRGFEVITIAYDEAQKGRGGVHCSPMELQRDQA